MTLIYKVALRLNEDNVEKSKAAWIRAKTALASDQPIDWNDCKQVCVGVMNGSTVAHGKKELWYDLDLATSYKSKPKFINLPLVACELLKRVCQPSANLELCLNDQTMVKIPYDRIIGMVYCEVFPADIL